MPSPQNSARQLAAILFADIVGYTSLMQQNEEQTLQIIKRYQEILDKAASTHHGKVLKNYGDGSLMTFSNSLDAVTAAKEIQENARIEPTVPLRIGIHVGEFIVERGDIYGNGVNLASRIESLGIEGTILYSKNVYQKIKNHPEFKSENLGEYEFKNVEEPMQVFALANEGFPIPLRSEMHGKLKSASSKIEGNFFQRIWQKKIPQILVSYILIAWLGLQLFDWALLQFGISPHWAKVFFVAVIGIIPSLLVYLNNRERIHSRHLKLKEKILFPTNIVAVFGLLFIMFKSSDLGAISTNITFLNAEGQEETINVVKEEFQKQIPVFRFLMTQGDSVHEWLEPGLAVGIATDINQNKYINAHDKEDTQLTTNEKIEEALDLKGSHYIDGSYVYSDGQYVIRPQVRNSKNGKLIIEREFTGTNFFALVDSISLFVRNNIGLRRDQINQSIDLDIKEMTTYNTEAFKYFALGKVDSRFLNYEKALELDSSFALLSLELALGRHISASSEIETKLNIDQAMRHRKRLPYDSQIAVLTLNHLINENWEKAEQLLKMQLEVAPTDPNFNLFLLGSYLMSGQISKYIKHSKKLFSVEPNYQNGIHAMNAAMMDGDPDFVITRMKGFLLLDSQNIGLLGYLAHAYIHKGEYDLARETIEKIILIEPDSELTLNYLKDVLEYSVSNKDKEQNLTKFMGTYRNPSGGQYGFYQILGNHFFNRAKNQFGLFMYQSGDSSFVHATPSYLHYKRVYIKFGRKNICNVQ